MDINSAQFQQFVKHILSFEGGLSKDPRDTAVRYAPFPGAYHTNKGVTYAAFTALGPKLGITPISYERFLKLTDQDVAKFIYQFYKSVNGDKLPGSVGLSVAEAAWGSGPVPAIKQLQQALINLKKLPAGSADGKFGAKTLAAVKATKEKDLYEAFWKVRRAFIDSLTAQTTNAIYSKGWNRRIDSFLDTIKPNAAAIGAGAILLLAGAAYYFLAKKPITI